MNSILNILESSLIAGLVTFTFNVLLNRKKDTLSYITQERKMWREKIRELAEEIERCKFGGKGELDINIPLTKLKMNINTYGLASESDISHDSHIWQSIDLIAKVKSEDDFEREKEILLCYLSIMLKNDWERCKKEVKGDTVKIIAPVSIILMCVIIGLFYFVIFKRNNVIAFVGYLFIINVASAYVMGKIFWDIKDERDKREVIGLTKEKRKRKSNKRIVLYLFILAVLYLFTNYLWFKPYIVKNVGKELYLNSSTNELYVNLNRNCFDTLEDKIRLNTRKEIHIVSKLDVRKMKKCSDIDKELCQSIIDVLKEFTGVYTMFLFLSNVLIMIAWEVLIGILISDKMKYENTVIQIRKDIEFSISSASEQLSKIILELKENKNADEIYIEKMIDLEYEILTDLLKFIEKKHYKKNLEKKGLADLKELIEYENKIALIKNCKKEMKYLKKTRKEDRRGKAILEIEKQIDLITN